MHFFRHVHHNDEEDGEVPIYEMRALKERKMDKQSNVVQHVS